MRYEDRSNDEYGSARFERWDHDREADWDYEDRLFEAQGSVSAPRRATGTDAGFETFDLDSDPDIVVELRRAVEVGLGHDSIVASIDRYLGNHRPALLARIREKDRARQANTR